MNYPLTVLQLEAKLVDGPEAPGVEALGREQFGVEQRPALAAVRVGPGGALPLLRKLLHLYWASRERDGR